MHIFEREEVIASIRDCIVLNEPAIEPVAESKPPAFIWRELAKRVGLEEYFNKDTEDWLRMRFNTPDPAIAEADPPITLDRLRQEKVIRLNVPEESHSYFDNLDFETASGRIEFYHEKLANVGHAMGAYVDPQILGHRRKKYPLQFFPGRHRFFMQGQFQEYPELRAIAGKVSVWPKTGR
jgi:anaerobic selenocysteine-containing dehydrogenase